jgi:hypothetical protein
MSIYSARKRPFPYHLVIGSTGLLMGSAGPNKPMLVSSKIQDIAQVAPPDYSYAGSSPISDRDQPYESLVLGYGWTVQEKWQDMRYTAAQAVDLSVHPWCKGPEITLFTPPTRDITSGVRGFFELGGVLYCAQGRYILRRDADNSWPVAKDFGAGVAVLNVTVFASNFDGIPMAWVALNTGPAQYSSDGTTWTAMPTFTALAFASVGREWWMATDTNLLRKCDTNADPRLEANYTTTQFRVGDKSSHITALMISAAGTLIIAKTDGVYTLRATGDDWQLFPFLEFAPIASNGQAWGQFENSLYTSYGRNLIKIDTDLSGQDVGPERLINNDSPVRGRITSFAAVGGMFALAGLFNPDTNFGYLMKFGAYTAQGSESSDVRHLDVWHGSISEPFANRALQALFPSTLGAPAAHTRTYVGLSEGTVGWLVNPCVANPAACEAYRFHVGVGFVDLPTWHGGYHASVKSLRHFSVTGERLDADNYVSLEYKLDPAAGSFTQLGPRFDSATYEIAPFPASAATVLAEFRVNLHNTLATASPLVSAVSIGHALRPKRYMQVELTVLCSDGLVRRDGVPMRIGRRQIQRVVEEAVDNPGAVTCVLPDESTQDLSFTDYAISQSFDEIGRQWRGSLTVKAVQWNTVLTEV